MNSYKQRMQSYTRQFEKETGKVAYTAKDVARWIIAKGLWKAPDTIALQKCANDLSEAWREEYKTDPQGRRVRTRHAFLISEGGIQLHLWGDWEKLAPKHMALSFQGRRKQVVGECRQLKNDVDSYNDNLNKDLPILVSYNFTLDLRETDTKRAKTISSSEQVPLAEQSPYAARQKASERVISRP